MKLRELVKYIPIPPLPFENNFDDEIISQEWKDAESDGDELHNCKAKAEFCVRQHQDKHPVIVC